MSSFKPLTFSPLIYFITYAFLSCSGWITKENTLIIKSGPVRGISIFLLSKGFTSLNCCLWHCILVWSTPPLWSCIQYNFIQNSYEGFLFLFFYWECLQRNRAQFLKDCNNFMIQKTKAHSRSWETKLYTNFAWCLWRSCFISW